VPAAIAFVLLAGALIALGVQLPWLVDWATPFADRWDGFWQGLVRITLGVVVFAGSTLLAAVTFTALTLVIGDPFYERIWKAVEEELGGTAPDEGAGFWRAVVDGLQLIGLGIVFAALAALVGFIPVVGGVAGAILGVALTGRLLARELTGRAFEARGLTLAHRRALLRSRRWRVLGFGVATQLCFLVPLGAVATMPAAVAGSTMLARELLDTQPTGARPNQPA
jgi:CysZ protein